MNKEYKIKLDLNKKLYNKKMTFNQFDENVNDFYIEVTKNNEVVKGLDKSIVTLVTIKPNNTVDAQFIEAKEGQIYADLKPSMCDIVGNYQAKAMIVLEGEILTTDTINYSVSEDKIISRLNDDVVSDERFPLFTDALSRLSIIETSEEERIINEAERILSEENRKIEEAKRVEAELVRQHEEADRAKYDATREGNENIRKLNEDLRKSNENIRLENEAKRVEEENKRKLAEEERNANYNFMTEDEERRRLEANTHKETETLRVQAETNRANEEAKRRTTEQARVSAENTRVSNENTRKSNETTRQNNETQRVNAETQRQTRYNTFIVNAESNANNFEGYVKNAKANEEERKSNELDRKAQENRRVSNETERISKENSRKANEATRQNNETSRQNVFSAKVNEVNNKISEIDKAKSDMTNTISNKVKDIDTRFNTLTSKQQQDAEVVDARTDFKGNVFDSLKERIDHTDKLLRDNTVSTVTTESDFTTVEETANGYFEDVKLEGKTLVNIANCRNKIQNMFYKQGVGATNFEYSGLTEAKLCISTANAQCLTYQLDTICDVGKVYTIMFTFNNQTNNRLTLFYSVTGYSANDNGKIVTQVDANSSSFIKFTFDAIEGFKLAHSLYKATSENECVEIKNLVLLEGDHTQNPPSYFEGLMSVGQDVDEVSVESVNENLLSDFEIGGLNGSGNLMTDNSMIRSSKLIRVKANTQYVFTNDTSKNCGFLAFYYDKGGKFLSFSHLQLNQNGMRNFITPNNCAYIKLRIDNGGVIIKGQLEEGELPTQYVNPKQDKKRILYYNEETQTWEKPILRQWDSIEKHSDGKYYYHKRSGEILLDGNENWYLNGMNSKFLEITSIQGVKTGYCICDKLISDEMALTGSNNSDKICIRAIEDGFRIRPLNKIDISLDEGKQWLQANPTTVAYQLAQEEVYECTNIDLITYDGETNYIVNTGAITPKSTLKVHNNIGNVVKILQEKVNLLESNVKASQEVQDMMILESDMRILDMELALMEHMPIKLNLANEGMLRSATYFNFIKNHIVNETYDKGYMENVMNKYLATNRLTQEEYDELYKMLYPQNYDIELPIEE